MAQLFEHIIQSINNSELRIAIEKLFAIIGVGIGDKEGSVTVTGTLTGNVTGNLTGNVTGNLLGENTFIQATLNSLVADTDLGDGDFSSSMTDLDGTDATVAVTKFTPTKGRFYVLTCVDATNAVTVTTSAGVTFDGTNNTATFDAAGETLVLFAISATQMIIVENVGSVAMSSV